METELELWLASCIFASCKNTLAVIAARVEGKDASVQKHIVA